MRSCREGLSAYEPKTSEPHLRISVVCTPPLTQSLASRLLVPTWPTSACFSCRWRQADPCYVFHLRITYPQSSLRRGSLFAMVHVFTASPKCVNLVGMF
jgi:hypothetical protein